MSEQSNAEKVYPLARRDGGAVALAPQNLEDAYRLATRLANSGLVPREMQGNPDSVLAAMLLANELGVGPMAGLTNIAVVNGRAYVWGELLTGLVWQSGLCEKLDVKLEGSGANAVAVATGKRKGQEQEVVRRFSMQQAIDAKLAGPHADARSAWAKYPTDMLQNRALNRVIKFLWPDVVKGLRMRELQNDEKDEIAMERGTAIVIERKEEPALDVDVVKEEPNQNPPPVPERTVAQEIDLQAKADEARRRKEALEAEQKAAPATPAPEPKPAATAAKPGLIDQTKATVKGMLDRVTYKTEAGNYVYRAVVKCGTEEYRYVIKGALLGADKTDKDVAKYLKDTALSKQVEMEVDLQSTEVLTLKVQD